MEKWPEQLLLVRHGQSEANVRKEAAKKAGLEPAWTGVLRDQDSPLTPLGNAQTGAFLLGLACLPVAAIFLAVRASEPEDRPLTIKEIYPDEHFFI